MAATGGRGAGTVAMIDWLFRSRATGRITVAQAPNAPLVVFLAAAGIRWLFHPTGVVGTVIGVVGSIALVAWAVDEIVRGVNPCAGSSVAASSWAPASPRSCTESGRQGGDGGYVPVIPCSSEAMRPTITSAGSVVTARHPVPAHRFGTSGSPDAAAAARSGRVRWWISG